MTHSASLRAPRQVHPWWTVLFTTPWLWAAALTALFYAGIEDAPFYRDELRRYFCSHPVEYVQVLLFFLAAVDLLGKAWGLRQERLAQRLLPVERVVSAAGERPPAAAAAMIDELCATLPRGLSGTAYLRRMTDVAAFVAGRRSAEHLEDHLDGLEESAEDRLHGSFSLLGTVIWAIPIMGFLGTVLGITIAIAHITPEQLESSLGDVTGGLAVAFDTTAVALGQSLILVFGAWAVRQGLERELNHTESDIRRMCHLLFALDAGDSPLVRAEFEASRLLVERTESLIARQTKEWNASLDQLRSRWKETLDDQQAQLAVALSTGSEESLADHRSQLAELRGEFVGAYREAARLMTDGLAQAEASRQRHELALRDELHDFWRKQATAWETSQASRQAQAEMWLQDLGRRLDDWRQQAAGLARASESQMTLLAEHSRLLARIVDQEEHLAGLQQRLTDNLDAVRAAETFEQTLHSLNAAVHLLSAKQTSARAA